MFNFEAKIFAYNIFFLSYVSRNVPKFKNTVKENRQSYTYRNIYAPPWMIFLHTSFVDKLWLLNNYLQSVWICKCATHQDIQLKQQSLNSVHLEMDTHLCSPSHNMGHLIHLWKPQIYHNWSFSNHCIVLIITAAQAESAFSVVLQNYISALLMNKKGAHTVHVHGCFLS